MRRSTIAPTDQESCLHICVLGVRDGSQVAQAQHRQALRNAPRDVTRALVGHHALDPDAEALEQRSAPTRKPVTHWRLSSARPRRSQAWTFVDRDIRRTPARAVGTVAPLAGDAMAHAAEAGELLGIKVDQLARAGALVTAGIGTAGARSFSRLSPRRRRTRADGGRRDPDLQGDLVTGPALAVPGRRFARRWPRASAEAADGPARSDRAGPQRPRPGSARNVGSRS